MSGRSRGWRIAAVVFAVINVAGAVYAAAMGELPHALVHVALLVGGYFAWQLVPRKDDEPAIDAQIGDSRIEHIQESVDSIALNVERIGEAQRFQEKLVRERVERGEDGPKETG